MPSVMHNHPLKSMQNNIVFSHRPVAGVSVGALSENGRLFVAFAIVNDGVSRNGIHHPDRQDQFSRATARAIISSRINTMSTREGMQFVAENPGGPLRQQLPEPTRFGLVFETDMTDRQFMAEFRQSFKPTLDESDEFLFEIIHFGIIEEDNEPVEVRMRPFVVDIAGRLEVLATEVIANASASV